MKKVWFALGFSLLVFIPDTFSQNAVDLEGGWVIPGYNDVAIPGDSGTRFSLAEDLASDSGAAFRLRYSHTFREKHWIGLLVAPLTVDASGSVDRDIDFNGTTFPAGPPLNATFRFDSYRLIYRYQFHKSDRWEFSFGGALKIRDAAIRLEGAGLDAEKDNTGAVPLLSFHLSWTPAEKWKVLMDGEALAAPQGRAEDILLAVQYEISPRVAVRAGYRILEGGADNDRVYTFSLFHYATAGVTVSF